jgi:hypothetical protein
LGSAVLWTCASAIAPAAVITQSASLPLTTDLGTAGSSPGSNKSLVFQQFDSQGGTRVLDSVGLSVHALIQNDFSIHFVTPATITASVATNDPTVPGPKVTVFQPDGMAPILTLQAVNDSSSLLRSVTYGFQPGQTLPQQFGSDLPSSSPFYLAPTITEKTASTSLTSPADLARFTGTGTVGLPVSATALAQITSSSGNGQGSVATHGKVDVQLTYNYHDPLHEAASQQVPEPAGVLLWTLAASAGFVFARWRQRLGHRR